MRNYDESTISRKADLSKYSHDYSESASADMAVLLNVSFPKHFVLVIASKVLKIQADNELGFCLSPVLHRM